MDIHVTHDHVRMSDKLLSKFFEVETNHWWWIARKRIVTKLLKKYLHKKHNVILDGGCGTGAGMIYLAEYGKVYGVDLSPIAVQFCKKRGVKNVKVASISSLPFQDLGHYADKNGEITAYHVRRMPVKYLERPTTINNRIVISRLTFNINDITGVRHTYPGIIKPWLESTSDYTKCQRIPTD